MKEITLEAVVSNIDQLTDFINEELEKIDCPMKTQIQIDVMIDEVFANISMYAYAPETGMATVRLETEEDPPAVILTFIDMGIPFNPLEKEDPDVSLSSEERPIGGLGIFMVKKSMDSVEYEYKDGQNILRIVKKL